MKTRGFTLIEVVVALFVIALGMGALLTTLASSADTVSYLRDKSFAQWIALNRLSELRLSTGRPETGVTRDTVEYAGSNWVWQQEISEAGIGGLLRVDVRVARVGDDDDAQLPEGDDFASLGTAVGFLSATPTRGSGLTPDWSPRAPSGTGGPGGGDGDDEEDGGRGGRGGNGGGGGDGDGDPEAPPPGGPVRP